MTFGLPLLASFLYVLASWGLKRGLSRGAAPRLVTALSNLAMAGWSAPLIFFFPGQPHTLGLIGALLAGTSLFLGRFCAIRALSRGDLSLTTPLLGTKIIFVALFTSLFLHDAINPRLWGGALLTSLAIALLSLTPKSSQKSWWPGKKDILTLGWALLAALLFALTDITVQKFARLLGIGWFQPLMFLTLALLTPLLFLSDLGRGNPSSNLPLLPATSRTSIFAGSGIIGFQTSLMILVIGVFGHATATNIIYATRGLWAVLLETIAGGGSTTFDRRILILRLTGAFLLLLAVVLAVGSL